MNWTVNYWPLCVLGAALAASAVCDLRTGKIPNVITYAAVAVGLVGQTLAGGWSGDGRIGSLGTAGSLIGLAAGFLPMLFIWRAGGIGGGDAKLTGAIGALAGWRFVLYAMFWSFLAAALLAVVIMVRRRVAKRTLSRVGRFLLLALLPGGKVDPAGPDSPRVPFGLALLIGSAAAVVQAFVGCAGAGKPLF